MDWNSEMRLAGQLGRRLAPARTTYFSFSKSGDLPDHTWNPVWLRDGCAPMGQSWNIPNMNSEPGKSKWLAKENLEKMSHKANSNCHESVTQGLSESVLVSIDTCCTLFLQVNTLHISLLSIFVGILFCRAEGSLLLITGLMARIWCLHCHDPASASGQEPKPCFKLLQAEATRDQGEFCPMRLMQWKAFSNCSAHLSKTLLDTDVSGTRNAERSKL